MDLHRLWKAIASRQVISYLFDWVVLACFAIGGAVLNIARPRKRDFSLTDPALSYPYREDTISILGAFLIAVVAPGIIIFLVCIFLVRSPNKKSNEPRLSLWRRKLWELHVGWLGLLLGIIIAFILTQALKNLFGKNRPDFLVRCDPDLSAIDQYRTGPYQGQALPGAAVTVSWHICKSKDGSGVGGEAEFWDGFRSFPSGHCTIAFSGLVYLSLFLAAKLSSTVPSFSADIAGSQTRTASVIRKQAAGPPLYALVIVLIPVVAAMYIATTRYSDYKHSGFDVLASSIGGALCAWFGFRWYHPPTRQGRGWAWGPRSKETAFWTGIGTGQYGSSGNNDLQQSQSTGALDLERGERRPGQGMDVELQSIPTRRGAGSGSSQRALVP